jgi:hypothetical protein
MNPITVRNYNESDAEAWDQFLSGCTNGVFLGSRAFLSYHGNRFVDRSVIVESGGRWIGVFPAAEAPGRIGRITSHPGSTFGGLFFESDLRAEGQVAVHRAVIEHFRRSGYSEFLIRPVPTFYRKDPIEDDIHAITRLGATLEGTKPTCTLSLKGWGRLGLTKGRKSTRNKASKAGVLIEEGFEHLETFWRLLEYNLSERHQVRPVHSFEEFQDLIRRFPERIRLTIARYQGECVAGAAYFLHDRLVHTQYLSSNELGRSLSALDALIFEGIADSKRRGMEWFDFGTNHTPEGSIDENLFFYKQSFGAGSFNQWSFLIRESS